MKRKKYLKITMVISLLAACMLFKPQICRAAEKEKDYEGITTLKENKEYFYDLDGNGEKEKLKYSFIFNDDAYDTVLKLYVNDKLCVEKKAEASFAYVVQICDLDKSDKALDLFYFARMDSDGVKNATFARYDGTKIVDKAINQYSKDYKKFHTYRYSLGNVKGDGRFNIISDTPVFSEAIGCFNCYIPYQIKDNVISKVTTNTYRFTDYSKSYKYQAKKNFAVYKKVGSKEIAFTVKKGDRVASDQLYMTKSGKAYVRLINSKGVKGWINAGWKELFKERPAWG